MMRDPERLSDRRFLPFDMSMAIENNVTAKHLPPLSGAK